MIKIMVFIAFVYVGARALVSGTDWLQFAGLALVALLTLAGTVFTIRSGRQAALDKQKADQETAKVAVDAAAYERARASYEASIMNYEREMRTLDSRVQQAEIRAQRAEDHAQRAEDRAVEAEKELLRLRSRLMQFETLMAHHKIPVPPEVG